MARKRRSKEETKQVDALIERLQEFVRLNYVTAAEIAGEIGVNDSTVYSWLLGQYRPENPERLAEFLDSLPKENGSGIALRTPGVNRCSVLSARESSRADSRGLPENRRSASNVELRFDTLGASRFAASYASELSRLGEKRQG